MEIAFSGAGKPHAWCSIVLTDDFNNSPRRRLLTGVNLIRPLGGVLSNLPQQQVVKTMSGRTLGRHQWNDPNLAVAGSLVTPIVTIEPKVGFKPGRGFLRLKLDVNGISIDPASPAPDSLQFVQMDFASSVVINNWSPSDPTQLNVDITAHRQVVSNAVKQFHEGSLAIFSDLNGFDALAIVLDSFENPGAGTTVTAVKLNDLAVALTPHL